MELISMYLYLHAPFQLTHIHSSSIAQLLKDDWFMDDRSNDVYVLLNKRFFINLQHYRVIIRLKYDSRNQLTLNEPVPFAIIETEKKETMKAYGNEIRFVDQKVHHGKDVKSTIGYFEKGIPVALIDCIYDDLKRGIQY